MASEQESGPGVCGWDAAACRDRSAFCRCAATNTGGRRVPARVWSCADRGWRHRSRAAPNHHRAPPRGVSAGHHRRIPNRTKPDVHRTGYRLPGVAHCSLAPGGLCRPCRSRSLLSAALSSTRRTIPGQPVRPAVLQLPVASAALAVAHDTADTCPRAPGLQGRLGNIPGSLAAVPLGLGLAGPLAQATSPRTVLTAAAVLTILGTITVPCIRDVRDLAEPASAPDGAPVPTTGLGAQIESRQPNDIWGSETTLSRLTSVFASRSVPGQRWLSGTTGDQFVGVQPETVRQRSVEAEEVGALGVLKAFVRRRWTLTPASREATGPAW